MKKFTQDKGFSLIEILVAAAISSMVILMVYTSYRSILATIKDFTGYAEFYENINLTMARIDHDFSNAYYKRNHKKISFIAEQNGENSLVHFVAINHRKMRILGGLNEPYPFSDINEVSYFLRPDPNPEYADLFWLYRREERHYDEEPESGGSESVMLENVTGIKFEFKVRNDWANRWDSRENKRFPKAIKTTLKVKNYQGKEEEFVLLSYIDMNG